MGRYDRETKDRVKQERQKDFKSFMEQKVSSPREFNRSQLGLN